MPLYLRSTIYSLCCMCSYHSISDVYAHYQENLPYFLLVPSFMVLKSMTTHMATSFLHYAQIIGFLT